MSANSQEDVAVGLRSETLGDTTAETTAIWDSQLRRRWGLVLRHDGSELGEDSGYYCILRNDERRVLQGVISNRLDDSRFHIAYFNSDFCPRPRG